MKKWLTSVLPLVFICYPLSSFAVAVDPSKLVKVTPENNAKCVEYYKRQGEMYCSTTALQPQTIDPNILQHEKLKIMFDDRYWQPAWGKNAPYITTIEYVPTGDDINNWNELITSQFVPGLQDKVTLKQFAEHFIQKLKDAGYKPIITFHEDTKNRVIYEFRIEGPSNQVQDELQMVTKNNDGLYVLHYVIKKSDMGQAEREKWIQNLKQSSIKN